MKPRKAEPMLSAEDLAIGDNVKTKNDIDFSSLKKDIEFLKEEAQKQWEVIHNKGLSIGLPAQMMNDIATLSSNVNRMKNLWDSELVIEKEKKDDDEIERKFKRGDVIPAYYESRHQVERMRQDRIRISSWLDLVLDNFRRIQGRMQGKDFHDFER